MKKVSCILLILLILMGCGTKVPSDPKDPDDEVVVPPEKPVAEELVYSVFNGSKVKKHQYQAIAVMIENSPAARPHVGVGLADIVYEVAVDNWQVSRYLAIFQSAFPDKIGPNRSARIPFVKIEMEWMLPFVHYGAAATGLGNAKALIQKIDWPIRFDGVSGTNDDYFFRDSKRSSPHNAFFNAQDAKEKIPVLTYVEHFKFNENPTKSEISGEFLRLNYSSVNNVSYKFDIAKMKYLRFINDDPMMDAYTNEQVAVTNIILQYAPHRAVESVNYVLVDFLGTGKAEFFINGKYILGTWKKDSDTAITKFYDEAGNELVLMPGNTWIQLIHSKVQVSTIDS